MAKWGGKQENAGRKKGSLNKRTQEILAKAAEDGISPIEVLLEGMRYYYDLSQKDPNMILILEAESQTKSTVHTYRSMAKDYAVAAAPYIHPKLANVQANVSVTNHESALAFLKDDKDDGKIITH